MHPLVQGMVSAGEDSPPREQFYRNEISNLFFSFLVLPLTSFLGVIFVIILELSRLNSVSQNSSLRLTWKYYILQLYFFLTNKVSAKNNSQQQEYISRGILLSSDRIFEIFWLRTKKMSLLHSRALKILTPTRRAPGEEKNVWGFSPIIRPEVRAKIRVYFKIRARGEQGGGKEMVLWKSVHPFLNPSVWWQMVSRLVTWHFELDLIMRRIIEQVRNRVSRPSNVNLWHLSDISCKGCRPKSLFRALDTKRIDLAARVKKKTQFIDIR